MMIQIPQTSFSKHQILITYIIALATIAVCGLLFIVLNPIVSTVMAWSLASGYSYDTDQYYAVYSIFEAILFFILIGCFVFIIVKAQRRDPNEMYG